MATARIALPALLMGFAGSIANAQTTEKPRPPIFVLNSLDASVSVIDSVGYTEIRRIPTGKQPHHLYMAPDEKSLLVANALSDSITVLDPRNGDVRQVLTGIVDAYQLQFSPNMKWLVTAANRLNHIDIYRWRTRDGQIELELARRIPAGRTPSHIYIDRASTTAYVTLQDSDGLIAIDLETQTPRWTMQVGLLPADLLLSPDERFLFVALTGDRFVEVYDLSTSPPRLSRRIETGDGAHAFRMRGDARHAFVSNRAGNSISLIDLTTQEVVRSFAAPGGPDCMDLLADGRTLLVTSRWARKLTVIDSETGQMLRQVKVGRSPHGVWTLDHAPRR